MKQLDWKSFAIGVLLTTTVMFGTGAATSTNEKWDGGQEWKITETGALGAGGMTAISMLDSSDRVLFPRGWEPIQSNTKDGTIIWRKRIK